MEHYSSEQLKALLAGELSAEQETEFAQAVERDPELLNRLERLSGTGDWFKKGIPVPNETMSSSLDSAIERVVSESRIERVSSPIAESSAAVSVDSLHVAVAVPGIRIVREIGRGGMGVVFEGWDEHVGRKVAIKQLLPMRGSAGNAKERLLQEARAAGSLLHPNIVSIYGVHFQDDMPVLVQQFVEGETLQDRIDAKRYLSWQECVDVAKQIASALEAAHAAGIVHRDLKPDNILIEKSTNIVRIADFGIAKQSTVSGITASDKIAGTPAYMSPEQTAGDTLDARSDLFSLGSVIVAAVTGVPPFGLDDPFVVMDRIRTQNAQRLSRFVPSCPAWFDELVDRLLRKDLASRTASASDLMAALQRQSPTRILFITKNRIAMMAVAVAFLAICAISFIMYRQGTEDQPTAFRGATDGLSKFESTDNSSTDFVPTKSAWIRRNESEYDSLAEAVESAIDGDVIVIESDLECEPLWIRGKKLTLRGASKARPILRSGNQGSGTGDLDAYFIRTDSDLTLEGLEVRFVSSLQAPFLDERKLNAVVGSAPGTRLVIDRCKIVRGGIGVCLATGGHVEIRRTYIQGASIALAWFAHHSQAVVEDCILESRVGVAIVYPLVNSMVYSRSHLKLRHSTIRATDAISPMLSRRPDEVASVQLQDSIVEADHVISLMSLTSTVRDQIESVPVLSLNACLEISEERCAFKDACELLVSRRIKSVDRVVRARWMNLEQWLSRASNDVEPNDNRSAIVKMTRVPNETESLGANSYQFESISTSSLPTWIDQIGPNLARPNNP